MKYRVCIKSFFAFFAVLFFVSFVYVQAVGFRVWEKVIDPTSGDDDLKAVALDFPYVYLAGSDFINGPNNTEIRIEKRYVTNGELDRTFASSGVYQYNPSAYRDGLNAIAVWNNDLYIAGYDQTPGAQMGWRVERLDSVGNRIWSKADYSGSSQAYAIAANASGVYISGKGNGIWVVHKRRLSDGAYCTAANCGTQFGSGGAVSGAGVEPRGIALDGSAAYIVGYGTAPGNQEWLIEKRDAASGALVA
ncbi:hypothetical protein HY967_04105, partial [Candidatus Jorgensenbacteria bacterium]|nr:hypothetical protein [Candidatus Jorgensenbacteria bacterium]